MDKFTERITNALEDDGLIVLVYGEHINDITWGNIMDSETSRLAFDTNWNASVEWELIRSCMYKNDEFPMSKSVLVTTFNMPIIHGIPDNERWRIRLYPIPELY